MRAFLVGLIVGIGLTVGGALAGDWQEHSLGKKSRELGDARKEGEPIVTDPLVSQLMSSTRPLAVQGRPIRGSSGTPDPRQRRHCRPTALSLLGGLPLAMT